MSRDHAALPATREELLSRIDGAWSEFLAALDGVPPERAGDTGVCGNWSVIDIVGHVAFWDGYVAGHLPWTYGKGQEYWDGVSHAAVDERRGRSLPEAHRELLANHESILATIRDEQSLDMPLLAEATFEHYAEHAGHLRSFLATIAPED